MKVLHIIWNAKFGGIEKIVFELAEEQLNSSEVVPAVLISKEEGEFRVDVPFFLFFHFARILLTI